MLADEPVGTVPDAIEDQKAAAIEFIENSDLPEELKSAQIENAKTQTPVSSAVPALVGTVITSLIAGAIVGAFVRKK